MTKFYDSKNLKGTIFNIHENDSPKAVTVKDNMGKLNYAILNESYIRNIEEEDLVHIPNEKWEGMTANIKLDNGRSIRGVIMDIYFDNNYFDGLLIKYNDEVDYVETSYMEKLIIE